MNRYEYLRGTHDLPTLPQWGPYARDVYALSRIADVRRGLRFDFFMVPGILRRQFYWPDPLRENGCSPTAAAADLRHFAFRQQLSGVDRFFADTSYTEIADDLWLGRCRFVNRTRRHQSAALLLYTRISPLRDVIPVMPDGCVFVDGLDYTELKFARPRCDWNLTSSGGRRGEQPCPGTVGGSCLGLPHYDGDLRCFGEDAGDCVTYRYSLPAAGKGAFFLRACVPAGVEFALRIVIDGIEKQLKFTGSGNFDLLTLYCGQLKSCGEVTIRSLGVPGGLRIDGMICGPECVDADAIRFAPLGQTIEPVCAASADDRIDAFSCSGFDKSCAVWWNCREAVRREYRLRNLAHQVYYSNNLRHPFYYSVPDAESGDEYCRDVYILPIELPPGETAVIRTLYAAAASPEEASARVKDADHSPEALEALFSTADRRARRCRSTTAGRKFRFGRMMLAAASLTNVNFPIRAEGENIRHHVPDKHFNSLYSWDSGFIGLGFLEIDPTRAIENLNAYLTEPDNDVNAFLFHGTPLPVQAYLYQEIFNRTQDREMLEFFYPKLRHFYDFLAGHIPSSIFRAAKSDLLRPWQYTYNSGGWDDYPAQWRTLLEQSFSRSPVVNTAHQIRFAKILRRAALLLGRNGDIAIYDRDIADFAGALQKYSYDPDEGIFSYVEHDDAGNPLGFYLDPASGRNYNLGMDGVSPLVSGICSHGQKEKMFSRLADPERMWTPIGISTVDKQAPYYRTDGYWNGAVWMPHQWFFWKAALNDGRSGFARRIALTALELWEKELRRTRYCFEHFCLSSRAGAGCCHFGGLSSPILNWFGAYCIKNTFSCGYDVWVLEKKLRSRKFTAELLIEGDPGESTAILYVNGADRCEARFNGQSVPVSGGFPGCWEATLPQASSGTLELVW